VHTIAQGDVLDVKARFHAAFSVISLEKWA